MIKNVNRFLDKVPILKYILQAFIKWLIIAAPACGILYAVLYLTGAYEKMESFLDLRYDSPFVLVPLTTFAALAVLCFVIGFLLYFHKYKRPLAKSRFSQTLQALLNDRQKKDEKQGDSDK